MDFQLQASVLNQVLTDAANYWSNVAWKGKFSYKNFFYAAIWKTKENMGITLKWGSFT